MPGRNLWNLDDVNGAGGNRQRKTKETRKSKEWDLSKLLSQKILLRKESKLLGGEKFIKHQTLENLIGNDLYYIDSLATESWVLIYDFSVYGFFLCNFGFIIIFCVGEKKYVYMRSMRERKRSMKKR